jgi:parallel beta-helix repeat protein
MIVACPRQTRLRVELLEDRAVPATLFVDDDRLQIRNAEYETIQAAVDAADAGDTIIVAPGFYAEQVTFGEGKDDITLRARNPLLAVIQAPAELTGEKAIVTIDGADGVTVRGFTITGPGETANALEFGVAVVNGGSAVVRNNVITAIRNDPLDGIQLGVAVYVAADGQATSAVIRDNVLADYQKGGVVVDGEGASADITGNTIAGSGATDLIAQNGVQVSDGAVAVVVRNDITGHVYTGDDFSAIGVFADAAGGLIVSDNKLFDNQIGLAAFDTAGVVISGNRVFDNDAGVFLSGVDGGLLTGNRVEDNGSDGVVLTDTTAVLVFNNTVRRNGGDGLVLTGESANNFIFGNTLRQNDGFDAFDDTTGPLTGGTANLWFQNRIGSKNVPGLR